MQYATATTIRPVPASDGADVSAPSAAPPAWRRTFTAAAVVAAVLSVMSATQSQAYFALHPGDAPPWAQSLAWSAAQWFAWALFVPAIARLAWGLEFVPGATAKRLVQHAAAAALFALGHLLLQSAALWLLPGGRAFMGTFQRGFLTLAATSLHWEILSYALVVAAILMLRYRQRARAEALRSRQLEAAAARAQLDALKRQMQPHFLFNALNALVSMQAENSAEQAYTIRLSQLLRELLKDGERATSALEDELAIVGSYLEIERARLGPRLRSALVVERDIGAVRLPGLLLQPLVENAITHGIALDPEGGELTLHAARAGDRVTIEIANSLRSIDVPPERRGNGVALANCRQRLALLFGDAARFSAQRDDARGFRTVIEVPLATAGPA